MKNLPAKEALKHASNEEATPADLHELAQHADHSVKLRVASNPNTAEHTLQHLHDNAHLFGENAWRIKTAVANNDNAPAHLVNDKIKNFDPKKEQTSYRSDLDYLVVHPKAYPDVVNKKMHSMIESESKDEEGKPQSIPFDTRWAAEKWLKGPHSTNEDAAKYLDHHDKELSLSALESGKLKESQLSDHLAKQNKLNFGKADKIVDNHSDLSPDFLKGLHKRASDEYEANKEDSDYSYGRDFHSLKSSIYDHPNVPKEVLDNEIEHGGSEEGHHYYGNEPRIKAFKHPSIDPAVVDAKARTGDDDAIRAALQRPDTEPSLLEHMWGKFGKANKKNSSWQDQGRKADIIRHPNFPEALAKKEASKDTELARRLLEKKNLSPDMLKEIVMHKNQDVALEALKHPNVDQSVVEHAFKRKAAEVSRAASNHPLATAEMKAQKVEADPKAAALIAHNADPDMAKAIFDKHGHHFDVAASLLHNPNASPEIVSGILKHSNNGEFRTVKDESGRRNDKSDEIYNMASKSPSLDSSLRTKLLKENPYYTSSHPDLQPDEMEEALNFHKNGTHYDAARTVKELSGRLLNHDNMSPELAKKIVTSEFGPARSDNYDLSKPHFTRDVIKAGLEVQPELSNPSLVNTLASSEQLTPEDIKGYLGQNFDRNNLGENEFHNQRAQGLLRNKNASKEVLASALNGSLADKFGPQARINALNNSSLGSNDLKDHYQNFDTFEKANSQRNRGGYVDEVAKAIQNHGLVDDALTTAHPDVVNRLVKKSDWSDEIHKDRFAKALEHPVPSVVKSVIETHGPKFRGTDESTKAGLFDRFASEPNSDTAKAAYPYMSKVGQDKMLQSADLNDPFVIQNASDDTIKNFKINKDTTPDVVTAILRHNGVTLDHLNSAIDHSPDSALEVLDRINPKNNQRRGASIGSGKYTPISSEERDALHQKILDTHPDDNFVTRKVINQTNSPDTIKKAIQNPNSLNYIQSIIENKSVKSGDLDHFKQFKDPESSNGMGTLAASDKASVGLLGHIAQHYPEHLPDIAANPKAGSAKLLKTLIDKGDLATHAELAKNAKVPPEVRGHLMKNPKVLMAADPRAATPEMLDELSKGDDIDTHKFVVDNPNATPEHRAASVKYALQKVKSGSPADSEKAQRIIQSGLKQKLHESALDEIASQGEDQAAIALKNEGATPALAMKHLDQYKGSPKILDSLVDSPGSDHPAVMDKMLDYADFKKEISGGVKDTFYAPARMNLLMMKNDDSVKDSHIEKFYNKLKEARPDGYAYDNEQSRMADASAMRWVAGNIAKPEIQKELSQHPAMFNHLIENNRLSKQSYDDLVNKFMNGDEKFFNEAALDRDTLGGLADHPQASSESLDSLYNHAIKTERDPHHLYDLLKDHFARNTRLSPQTAEKILDKNPEVTQILRHPALPPDRLKHVIEQQFGHMDNLPDSMKELRPGNWMNDIASNPKFRLSMLSDIPLSKVNENPDRMNETYKYLLRNPHADSEDIRKAFGQISAPGANFDRGSSRDRDALKDLIENPKAPEDLLRKILENPTARKEDFYHSPAVGGEIWREQEHKFPMGLAGVKRGNEINQALFRPREEKIKQIQSMIPEGGKLVWGDFKKQNPSLAGDPLVQKMFTSAPKQMVDQAHAQKYLDDMPKKEFHVSYVPWNGMQRHNDKTQAVFQLNNGPDQDAAYKSDPNLMGLYKMIQKAGYRSGHPVNPQAIGWSRVDTSNPDHWFIDEVQSDYGSGLSRELDQIQKTGRSNELEKHGIEPSKAKQTLNKMVDIIQGWEKALVNNVIETAKKHGVKKVSMHSGESKTLVNKGKQAEVTNKYDKLYNKMPQEMGFKENVYDNVPSGSKESSLKGQKIWTLNMAPDDEEDLKNKRREKLEGKMGMKNPKDETE